MAAKIWETLEAFRAHFSRDPDMDELVRWLNRLRDALRGEMPTDEMIHAMVKRYLSGRYRTVTKSINVRHALPRRIGPEAIAAEFRPYLQDRIRASVELIKLNRDEEIERQLRRFAGWATGARIAQKGSDDFAELKKGTHKALSSMTYVRRRVCIDQGHKLMAAIDDTIAQQYGALAREWRHIIPHAGYDSRKEHLARDHKIYAVRGAKGVKPDKNGYVDELDDQPGELPYCSCFYLSIYNPDELPEDMRTNAR